ncbi:MAG: DNA repair protein RadC [Flavobacteriales bacterium]
MNEDSTYPTQKLSIKAWAEDDRPREKMIQKGRDVLTNAELIGILIGSGTREESAIDIAKRILASVENDLNKLGELSLKDLMKFKGIGEARAINIASALELGRRRKSAESSEVKKITSSKDSFDVLYPYLADLNHEQFYALLLNRNNKVIEVVRISQGGVSGTVADTKLIFKAAIDRLASSIIVAHNHPSGNLKPSRADETLTSKLKQAGELVEVTVLDHLIIAGKSYFSFADEGLL